MAEVAEQEEWQDPVKGKSFNFNFKLSIFARNINQFDKIIHLTT